LVPGGAHGRDSTLRTIGSNVERGSESELASKETSSQLVVKSTHAWYQGGENRAQPGAEATWALPSAVVAALEIRKPSPFDSVHFMPAVDDAQVNGPRVIVCP
jgi:hypothetical protein